MRKIGIAAAMSDQVFEVTAYITVRATDAAEAEEYVRETILSEPEVERVSITTVRTPFARREARP